MCEKLDKISPSTAPHKHYVAFRYVDPLTENTMEQIEKYLIVGYYFCLSYNFILKLMFFLFLEMVLKE